MEFPKSFIRASEAYNTFEHHVPAPYLRRAFQADHEAKANVIITALGFYELYLNGERITKGRLTPYISNPDDLVYYDTYEVTLRAGENVLGVWLGNGFTNNPGGHIIGIRHRCIPCRTANGAVPDVHGQKRGGALH